MSRFFSEKFASLTPYTPGEQPRERKFIKLNTNESPFPPSAKAQEAAARAAETVQLYSDPTCKALAEKVAERYEISADEVILVNGSDEVLNFAFMAFCDKDHPAAFPDITYGFYEVQISRDNRHQNKHNERQPDERNVEQHFAHPSTAHLFSHLNWI